MAGESSQLSPAEQPSMRQSFDAHVELLRAFLTRRGEIAARIVELLNAERKGAAYLQDSATLSRHFGDCFFALAGIASERKRLERELETAHWASGFKPRQTAGQHNDLIDPAEVAARAFLMWQRTRWPGDHGRTLYAHTLFNLYLLRRLMLLSMRVWDAGSPSERLAQVQGVLDELWRTTPPEQPVLVRDARWLVPVAQSPTTDELHGYFEVAARIAETLPAEDRIEIHKASVRLAGGHLRSQLRHVSGQKRVALDEHDLVSSTRKSNALDLATLVQGLVPLLEAYDGAAASGDSEKRLELADAICQAISPDPELFLNRLDLLGPYSMIEHLFIATDADGRADFTPSGERHLRLLEAYATLLRRTAKPLHADCVRFRPVAGAYSPYGVLYGFSSRLLEHMALKAAHRNAMARFSLEDVFVAGGADKLAWVSGWRQLPHVPRDVIKQFDYPQQFAEDVHGRIERALHRRVHTGGALTAVPNGRLFVTFEDDQTDSTVGSVPDLPIRFVESSDRQAIVARQATARDEAELMGSRLEGEFVVSYRTPGGWTAVTKDILTDVVGAGRDAKLAGLPRSAARVLKLMCPDFVVLARSAGLSDR